jgi:hypothetical protein
MSAGTAEVSRPTGFVRDPLAFLFLCAAAALVATGVGTSQALSVAVSVGALGVFSGAALLLIAVGWRTGVSLTAGRARA